MCLLSVNVDHVATLREARKAISPDPVHAAVLAELGGADGITCICGATNGTSRFVTSGS